MNSLGNKEIMAKNIQYYLDKKGIDRNEMCSDLGFKYTTVSNWLQGVKYPRIDKIELMARYFGISKADLVEDHSAPSELEYTDEEKGIVRGYRKAPDDTKQIVRLALGKYMKDDAPAAPPKEQPKEETKEEAPATPPKEQPKEETKEEAPKIGKWGQIILHHKYALYQGFDFISAEEVESLAGNPKIERIVEDTYKKLEEADVDYDLFVERLVEIYKSHRDKLHALLNEPHDTAVLFLKKYISDRDNFI